MKLVLFVLFATLYVIACAATDGLFNRLVFREHRRLSYFSTEKRLIYLRGEWSWISVLFLLYLGLVAPSLASFAIGGVRYLLVFWLIFALVNWDVIFGRIVFDDWLGDLPSMKLFRLGWIHTSIWVSIGVRLALAGVIAFALARWY
ncbi:MAG: hypothetical protein U0610_03805 [bacterium]